MIATPLSMTDLLSTDLLIRAGVVAILANEVRGFVVAAPVLYVMFRSGGNLMTIWLCFCALVGVALTTVAPLIVARKLKLLAKQPG